MEPLRLIVERQENQFCGRVMIEGTLFTDFAETTEELTRKLRKLAINTHGVKYTGVLFHLEHDLEAFFFHFKALNISEVARLAGLNSALVRQYASGVKTASSAQSKKIEEAVHFLGRQLQNVKLLG
jgi:hypothetical protein